MIGGGAVGCSVAYHLAREGIRVRLVERDEIARHASGAAAGMLRPLGESRDVGPMFRWGLRSLERFPELVRELRERSGVDPELSRTGALDLATSEVEARALREKARGLAEYDVEWWQPADALASHPGLAPDLHGALWSPREANVRSPLLARAFAGAAVQLGAELETGVAVTGLRREAGRVAGVDTSDGPRAAAHVIVCAGAWSAICGDWLGSPGRVPVEPVRGQILSLDAPVPAPRAMIVGAGAYLVPKRDGSLVVGATQEHVGFDCRVTAAGIEHLLAAGRRLLPALGDCSFRSAWAGLRPVTPDRLPLVGPLPGVDGLSIAAGHHRNGVLLAPVTGELMARHVLGKGLPDDGAAFLPERFF